MDYGMFLFILNICKGVKDFIRIMYFYFDNFNKIILVFS